MKWICLPQCLKVPYIFDVAEIWYSPDYYPRRFALVGRNGVVLVEAQNLFPAVSIDGRTLSLGEGLYNGRPWFSYGNTRAFFVSLVRGGSWVYNPRGLYEPRSIINPDTGEDEGDPWYEGSWDFDACAASHATSTLAAHGSATGTVTVAVEWPHWLKGDTSRTQSLSCLGGEYSPVGGASGTVTLGFPAWTRSTDGRIFLQRNGEIVALDGLSVVVPASSVDPLDETGDYVFSDANDLRLRVYPTIGRSPPIYIRRDDGYDVSTGTFEWLGEFAVPYLPSGERLPVRPIYAATIPQWM